MENGSDDCVCPGRSMKTAYATIKGFEVMRMIRRRQCILLEPGVTGEVRFVNKLFDLAA
jgi:transposase, IS6 family